MRPYSTDLRQRVLAAYRRGEGSIRELADDFEIAASTVESWLALTRATGSVEPRAHGGGAQARLKD
jgi:transposase